MWEEKDMTDILYMSEIKGKLDLLLTTLDEMKEERPQKIYSTDDLVEYLRVGKGTLDKLRQNGELTYSRLGRTIVYTQQDVDNLIKNNHITYV